jgi:transposase-like protein
MPPMGDKAAAGARCRQPLRLERVGDHPGWLCQRLRRVQVELRSELVPSPGAWALAAQAGDAVIGLCPGVAVASARVRADESSADTGPARRSPPSSGLLSCPGFPGTVKRVADQLGYGVESVRSWVRQAEVDGGLRAGTTSANAERIKELEQEVPGTAPSERHLECCSVFLRGGARGVVDTPHSIDNNQY